MPTEKVRNSRRNWRKKTPWFTHYNCARCRCVYKYGSYFGKVKFLMTLEDFKTLWFKDKAYLMMRPSIDRIDSKGDYILDNCRFIELTENNRNKSFNPRSLLNLKFTKLDYAELPSGKADGSYPSIRRFNSGLRNRRVVRISNQDPETRSQELGQPTHTGPGYRQNGREDIAPM